MTRQTLLMFLGVCPEDLNEGGLAALNSINPDTKKPYLLDEVNVTHPEEKFRPAKRLCRITGWQRENNGSLSLTTTFGS